MAGPVQTATNTGAASPITVTLGSNTTAGNCLIVYVGTGEATTNPTVTGITLGGLADHFALAKGLNNNTTVDTEIWTDQNCAGGQTAVKVTLTAGSGGSEGIAVRIEEWAGVVLSGAVDKTNAAAGTTPWSSGSSGTLSQPSELVVGAVAEDSGSLGTITGPGAPWTNTSQINSGQNVGLISGWQVVSATTAQTYNGTLSNSASTVAVIVTLRLVTAAAGQGQASLKGQPAAVRGRLASILIKPPTVGGPAAKFFPPRVLLRGPRAAVKGRLTGTRGGAGVPSPFHLPGLLRGQPAARKGTLAGARGRPGVPAPFRLPGILRPAPGAARPGRLTGARGRPGVPSPFTAPRSPLHGQPAARRGALAGIVAPPPIIQPQIPAPFFPPHTPLRGQAPVMARTRTAYTAAPPPAPPPSPLAMWQGSTHITAADAFGNLIQGARHVGKGGPGQDLKGDYQRSGD